MKRIFSTETLEERLNESPDDALDVSEGIDKNKDVRILGNNAVAIVYNCN